MSAAARIADVARERLGIERLRPGQGDAVESLLKSRDDGPTIVVSPLLALQRDQLEAIEEQLPGEAGQLSPTSPRPSTRRSSRRRRGRATTRARQPRGGEPFAVGSRVAHPEWGEGDVQRYDEGRVVVLFETVGYKTLDLELVAENDLLSPA